MAWLIGTHDGLFELADGTVRRLRSGQVSHLAVHGGNAWAIIGGRVERLRDGKWQSLPAAAEHAPRSLLPVGEALLIGTAGAHLYVMRDSTAQLVDGFERAEGRGRWHTPWGGPPDTRSLARGAEGTLYANVHVGGVLRSADGETWQPTMDIGADVHQVDAHRSLAGCALVASAWGFGLTLDGAQSWDFTADGLHNAYCRAVALAGDIVLLSASDGPFGGRAALYRRPLRSRGSFERCVDGLPESFMGNIDSGCVAAAGTDVAFGTADGEVYVSADAGVSWSQAADGLPPIRTLAPSRRYGPVTGTIDPRA